MLFADHHEARLVAGAAVAVGRRSQLVGEEVLNDLHDHQKLSSAALAAYLKQFSRTSPAVAATVVAALLQGDWLTFIAAEE